MCIERKDMRKGRDRDDLDLPFLKKLWVCFLICQNPIWKSGLRFRIHKVLSDFAERIIL